MTAAPLQIRRCAGCGGAYHVGVDVHLCFDPADVGPVAASFMESNDLVRMLLGPVGSAKTSTCIMEIVRRACEVPRSLDGIRHSRALVIRNTYRELNDTTRNTFEQWVPPTPRNSERWAYSAIWEENDFTCTIRFGDVACEVLFRALDTAADIKKLLSLELTFAYINEAREVPKAVFDMVQNRLGRYPRKADVTTPENPTGEYWVGLWADSNPCDTDHWIYKTFEEERPEHTFEVELEDGTKKAITVRYALFHQPSGLGPDAENKKNLPAGYYERARVGKAKDYIEVNLESKYGFVRDGKPVFPEYHDEVHCKPVKLLPVPIVGGMDFGLTPAVTLGQRDPMDGQLQIFGEVWSDDMGAVRFAAEVARRLRSTEGWLGRPLRGWADPAGEQRAQTDESTPFDIIQAAGLPFVPAPTNDVTRRLEAVRGLLLRMTSAGRPALVIDPSCTRLRKALGGAYCYARIKVSGDERFKDEPRKNEFSHIADSLQYLCVGEGEDDRAIDGAAPYAVRRPAAPVSIRRAFRG